MSPWEKLAQVTEGGTVEVEIVDFENSTQTDSETPQTISGEVTRKNETANYTCGEVRTAVTIEDPREDGCIIDLGDTSKNRLFPGGVNKKYTKAWRPRMSKRRKLLGRIESCTIK
ncbi:MAG: hypothetical protein ABEH81_01330 [Halopenitus sp.]